MSTPFQRRIVFKSSPIPGSGRGNKLGFPTLNLNLADVPADLKEGIYAGVVNIGEERFKAAIHYGPRPFYSDGPALEIHLIDVFIDAPPESIDLEIVARLRDVETFSSEEALKKQIAMDIATASDILDQQ